MSLNCFLWGVAPPPPHTVAQGHGDTQVRLGLRQQLLLPAGCRASTGLLVLLVGNSPNVLSLSFLVCQVETNLHLLLHCLHAVPSPVLGNLTFCLGCTSCPFLT